MQMPGRLAKMLSIGLLPSSLKKRYYRWRGAKIGKGVSIGLLSIIEADRIVIGDHTEIGMMVMVKARDFRIGSYSTIKRSTTIVAPRIHIGNETAIMNDVVVGGMESWGSRFKIGDRCTVFPHCFINPTKNILIGDDVGIGGSTYLFTHGSWPNALEGFPFTFGPITIEDRVWLPWRVFVLPNVTIGHDSVIAAGSVVSKSIPPLSFAAGVPAGVKSSGSEFVKKTTKAQKSQMLRNFFQEFVDFLRLDNLKVSALDLPPRAKGVIYAGRVTDRAGRHLGSVLVMEQLDEKLVGRTQGPLYCVSLERIPAPVQNSIEKTHGAWFNASDYVWQGQRDRISTELRLFLTRFGVRFKSLDIP